LEFYFLPESENQVKIFLNSIIKKQKWNKLLQRNYKRKSERVKPLWSTCLLHGADPVKFWWETFDVDNDRDLIMNLGVRSVPTLKVYKEGSEVYSEPGVKSTQQLLDIMSKY
jgi:thioredoxin-related protein